MKNIKQQNKGAIALILIIMITTLTVLSSIVVAMLNTNEKLASYHISEGQEVDININTCIDDALVRMASSTEVSGSFNLSTSDVSCSSTISVIDAGFKIVTSTATSTSDMGSWTKTVVVKVNVSSSPISIDKYNESKISYKSFIFCGDGVCNGDEDGVSCVADCPVCGDGAIGPGEACDDGNTDTEGCGDGATQNGSGYCNSDCTLEYSLSETCDDGNTFTEACGNNVLESGADYCNSTCTATYAGGEACDYAGPSCGGLGLAQQNSAQCAFYCNTDCGSCSKYCL